MKALVYRGPKTLELVDAERPPVQPGEVLVRVAATGICGSDVHGYLGLTGRRTPPMIMGHEFCGTVAEVGSEVRGFQVGDRIAVQPVVFCGECSYCREGLTNLCTRRRFFGVMDCNGSMAEFLNVPARLLFRMPESMPAEVGAMVEPLAVAYRAVSKAAGRLEGSTVLVVGAGTIGLLVLAMVKLHRPLKVVVSDLSDRRLELARRLGADVAVNPSREPVKQAIAGLTDGRGADVSFEAVGAGPTVEQAILSLRPRGTSVWVGNSQRIVPLDMQAAVTKEISVLGSYIYTHAEFGEALDLLARKAVDVAPIISRTAALEQGPELFAALADPATELVKVVLSS
jgi:2-desacetyl-2-hydroxyethyl bacteriochlorophyllide A dehydrogenase